MKRSIVKAFVALALTACISNAYAENPETIGSIENTQVIKNAMDEPNKIMATMEENSRERRAECLKAFGHQEFCTCIFDKMPVAWNFQQYIAIATKTKTVNGYEALDDEYKQAYDMVRPIRDECVTELKF